MTKGILYYVWGSYNKRELKRSIDSAERFGYDYKVVESNSKYDGYRKRVDVFKNAPFDITLHLDTDTIILGSLDFGFDVAERYGLALCIAPASSAYDAHPNVIKGIMREGLPQYNCGVLFFNKKSKPVFNRWAELLRHHPESAFNDQPYLSQAVYEKTNPYVLPKNFNFRPHLKYESDICHGDIKILHRP